MPSGAYKKALILAIGGGLAFWLTNFAISLTPIAAEYRAGVSISYFPMLLEALVGGLIIGLGVSFFLLRFFDKIPTKNPILKSLILSFIALIIVTILLEVPSHFLTPNGDPMRYFLIGLLFNVLRILALGIVIGYLYKRL
jgi:predicted tellurium resistance membrane protein TerC